MRGSWRKDDARWIAMKLTVRSEKDLRLGGMRPCKG